MNLYLEPDASVTLLVAPSLLGKAKAAHWLRLLKSPVGGIAPLAHR